MLRSRHLIWVLFIWAGDGLHTEMRSDTILFIIVTEQTGAIPMMVQVERITITTLFRGVSDHFYLAEDITLSEEIVLSLNVQMVDLLMSGV